MSETPNEGAEKASAALPDAAPALANAGSGSAPTKLEQATSFWQHIKEHKILQWTLGYLGAALALVHGQELMAETFEWPHIIGRVLVVLLIVGLPIVLTLAWYHGHKGLKQIGAGEMAIICLLVLIGAGGFYLLVPPAHEQASANNEKARLLPAIAQASVQIAPETGVSLAVLPFVNMSDDKEQEYFSDGLSEELLNQLAQIKKLRVAGRTSSFAFKNKNEDLRVIAQALGVNHLLEGSVRKAGNRLRITAQLINGVDGSHLWSQSYDRELKDVFQVQEDIAKDVAQAAGVALGIGETARPEGGTSNVEAYDKYLRAKSLLYQLGPDQLRNAIELLHEAVAIDPNFALAWLELYNALEQSVFYIPETATAASAEMGQVSAHITALAADAWWTKAMLSSQYLLARDWGAALAAAKEAVETAPDSEPSPAVAYASALVAVGQANSALDYIKRAGKSDPLSLLISGNTQLLLDCAGRRDEAHAEYQRSNSLSGDHARWDWFEVLRLWAAKQPDPKAVDAAFGVMLRHESLPMKLNRALEGRLNDKAFAVAEIRNAELDPENADAPRQFQIAFYADHYGDKDLVLSALRRGLIEFNSANSAGVLWAALRTPGLREDERFKQIVRDLKLDDYWRASGSWGDFCHPVGSEDFECR